jgi:hypothetical protein
MAVFALAALARTATAQAPGFSSAHDDPIPGWTGPVFKLRQDYPACPPAPEPQPWKAFDFKTQAREYLASVLAYATEGNIEVDWQVEKNRARAWYHVPWLHTTARGREFVHGMTQERSSPPGELHERQSLPFSNYAVSVYNAPGGYVIGRVWRDPENPDPAAARFPDGTVVVKLLFTTATVEQVPYLQNAFEWQAHLNRRDGPGRSIETARLLQIDVGVRDSRADNATGWVFGTFAYDAAAPGATPWQRMVPLGLMYGNDPGLTPVLAASGARPSESVILNPIVGIPQHLGWLGRLNGPVDNPASSCLSCHSTAQYPPKSAPLPPVYVGDDEKMRWFRNVKAGEAFDAGHESLDYSLQLALGIQRFHEAQPHP